MGQSIVRQCPCTARDGHDGLGLEQKLQVLELFAGIGGWRLALDSAACGASISAYDSGPHCSEVYAQNFGESCCRRNIEQLGLKELDGFDLWLMSPPCQPFSTTREAKQRDLQDKRCAALEHLTKMLPKLERPPRWIALENVKGFHGSDACGKWRAALRSAGFRDREIILDLISFGTPNHRTRYYLVAERETKNLQSLPPPCVRPNKEHLPPGVLISGPWAANRRHSLDEAHASARARPHQKENIFRTERRNFLQHLQVACRLPQSCTEDNLTLAGTSKWKLLPLPRARSDALLLCFEEPQVLDTNGDLQQLLQLGQTVEGTTWTVQSNMSPCRPVGDFLEQLQEEEIAELSLSAEMLSRPYAPGLSYVGRKDVRSFCFTGHYGKVMHKSSGSLLYLADEPVDRSALPKSVGLVRFFSPKEILNFLGFPESYKLPRDMELKHRYKVVGNSIAVSVASELLRLLLRGEGAERIKALEEMPHRSSHHGATDPNAG